MSYKTDSKILYHLCDDLLPSVLKKYIITQDDYNKIEEAKKVLRSLAQEIDRDDTKV